MITLTWHKTNSACWRGLPLAALLVAGCFGAVPEKTATSPQVPGARTAFATPPSPRAPVNPPSPTPATPAPTASGTEAQHPLEVMASAQNGFLHDLLGPLSTGTQVLPVVAAWWAAFNRLDAAGMAALTTPAFPEEGVEGPAYFERQRTLFGMTRSHQLVVDEVRMVPPPDKAAWQRQVVCKIRHTVAYTEAFEQTFHYAWPPVWEGYATFKLGLYDANGALPGRPADQGRRETGWQIRHEEKSLRAPAAWPSMAPVGPLPAI